jgi:hypothetical protein
MEILSKDVHSLMAKTYSVEISATTPQVTKSSVDNPVFITAFPNFGGILIALDGGT